MDKKKYVYCVKQTQPSCDYVGTTIAVYTEETPARNLAKRLNKVYGQGCVFDKDGRVEEVTSDFPHYYEVECVELNPNPNDYLWSATEED